MSEASDSEAWQQPVGILLFGADGQLGRAIKFAAADARITLIGHDRAHTDITQAGEVARAIAMSRCKIAINAAAFTGVDNAEQHEEEAFAVNELGAGIVAKACAKASLPLIHISTDYVFGGDKAPPYTERDPTGPLNVYGRSKWAGEQAVTNAGGHSVILRTSWLYSPFGRNFVRTVLSAPRDTPVRIVDDQIGCPTPALALARTLIAIAGTIIDRNRPVSGIWHLCGDRAMSWHDFALEIAACGDRLGHAMPKIIACATGEIPAAARRPANSSLACDAAEAAFGITQPMWDEGLGDTVRQIMSEAGEAA